MTHRILIAAIAFSLSACGPTSEPGEVGSLPGAGADSDGDGVTVGGGDCDDENANAFPGNAEVCDGIDNDCSGAADEPFDVDGDGYATCTGDCDDADASRNPGSSETADGLDNDCNGLVDDALPTVDDDGDGFAEVDGDCDDTEPLVSPDAVEVNEIDDGTGTMVAENVDNDCDGQVDEGAGECDDSLSRSNVFDYPKSMELCNWVENVSFNGSSDALARNILGNFGSVYTPYGGSSMAVLSTGHASDASAGDFVNPNGGTLYGTTASHPDPQGDPADSCGAADPSSVFDYTELSMDIKVPSNAFSMSFDFNFMSGEFPEWVCTPFDDTFLAILESESFSGNISFDAQGRPVTINIGFFDVCEAGLGPDCTGDADLAGTGYGGDVGGGTGWLRTTAPVTPGETITLRFIVFDEGDSAYDSTVLIDNFRWQAQAVAGPITVD